ncbi:MAG: hypothetical protein ACT4P6_02925 [Gemmatimonadaceae bacterium]
MAESGRASPAWILSTAAKLSAVALLNMRAPIVVTFVASERVADDRVWDKCRRTLYERGGRRFGEMRSYISFTPFVVCDSLIVFETTPYERAGLAAEPAKLRAFTLAGGREVWSVPVRENVFRGPYPP